MAQQLIISGVPNSVALDAWWLSEETVISGTKGPPGSTPAFATDGRAWRLIGSILLVALADYLFWGHQAGVSLAVFAVAVFLCGLPADRSGKGVLMPATVLVLSVLPVVDFVQPLSVAFLLSGLVVAIVWVRHPKGQVLELLLLALGFLTDLPKNWLGPVRAIPGLKTTIVSDAGGGWTRVRQFLRNWGLPIGGTMVFVTLLAEANPVFQSLVTPDIAFGHLLQRALFWGGIALIIWPFVDNHPLRGLNPRPFAGPQTIPGLNGGSVLRALWVFNALIGVQTVLDLSILLGGASLPEGMSYASYAHRGAYPLLVTALLAGAFALAARPFLDENRVLKPLMVLWLAQNVALCGAALMRLDLYVGTYGLTYLRIYAQIWMGLVAAGLALVGWQIAFRKSNSWLIARTGILSILVLYCASFVNFAHVIATRNLKLPEPDYAYLCSLGPMTGMHNSYGYPNSLCYFEADPINSWQEWGFRKWRLSRYGAGLSSIGPGI
ncbi:DUF4173 domain-containing protein [Ruegeria faecimaris]|uniref:DUF4153 domain-containing protein n=1 Tax=Ruegeria faecimaris TaxID=686389 RepID=UPI002491901E|nr:DUF4173 domain-containing protein [Ruegeria faecimaris]